MFRFSFLFSNILEEKETKKGKNERKKNVVGETRLSNRLCIVDDRNFQPA